MLHSFSAISKTKASREVKGNGSGESKRFMPSDNVADIYLIPMAA